MRIKTLLVAIMLGVLAMACSATSVAKVTAPVPGESGTEADWAIWKSPATGICYEVLLKATGRYTTGISPIPCTFYDEFLKTGRP
mgnify:CR=1 FL=1